MKVIVKSLVYDDADNILVLVRSSTHPHYADEEDLPGGELEEGETPIDSAIREIEEETGLKIARAEAREVLRKIVEPDTAHILYMCRVRSTKPAIKLSWEHSSYKWTKVNKNRLLRSKDSYIATVNECLLLTRQADSQGAGDEES